MRKLSCLIVSVSLLFLLAACSSSTLTPTKVVTSCLDCLKKGDYQGMALYMVNLEGLSDIVNPEQAEIMDRMFSKLTYKNTSESVNGDNARVTIDITSVDFKTITASVLSEMIAIALSGNDSDDLAELTENMFLEKLSAPDAPMVTMTTTVNLVKVDSDWKISDDNDDFGNALIGGMGDLGD
jgi:hypothetical protein